MPEKAGIQEPDDLTENEIWVSLKSLNEAASRRKEDRSIVIS